jgi:argininosuccinate lyase
MPFRRAHQAVGRLVASLVGSGRTPPDATQADLDAADPSFEPGDLALLDPTKSLGRRATPGSGTPDSVKDQVAKIRLEVRGSR